MSFSSESKQSKQSFDNSSSSKLNKGRNSRRTSWGSSKFKDYLLLDIAEVDEESIPSNSWTKDDAENNSNNGVDYQQKYDENVSESPVFMNCSDSSPEVSQISCLQPVPLLFV